MIRARNTAVNKMDKNPCLMGTGHKERAEGKYPLKMTFKLTLDCCVVSPLSSIVSGTWGVAVMQMNKKNYTTTHILARNSKSSSDIIFIVS